MRVPRFLRRLYQAWMAFSHVLGKIMSTIILSVVWLIGFGIYGIVLRGISIFRKNKNAGAWVDPPEEVKEGYKFQF